MEVVSIVIVGLGLCACVVSIGLGVKFWRINHGLSFPIAVMCFGGAAAGFATLAFSIGTLLGFYGQMSDWLVALLRVIIFGGITGTDIYMFFRIRSIERGHG